MTAGAKPYTMKVVRTVFNGGHEETYGNATRLVPTQQRYCWPIPKYRLGVFHMPSLKAKKLSKHPQGKVLLEL
jgi:hypothetical protein